MFVGAVIGGIFGNNPSLNNGTGGDSRLAGDDQCCQAAARMRAEVDFGGAYGARCSAATATGFGINRIDGVDQPVKGGGKEILCGQSLQPCIQRRFDGSHIIMGWITDADIGAGLRLLRRGKSLHSGGGNQPSVGLCKGGDAIGEFK
jgi:hypothetical protein